jgi:phage shock protein C, pspC
MNRKIFKSRDNVLVDGVLGGIAEYFDVDPTLVRLAFVFGLIFLSIDFILFYIFAAIIIPRRPVIVNDELQNNVPLKNMSVDLKKPVEEVKPQETEIQSEENITETEEVEAIYLRGSESIEETKHEDNHEKVDEGADYEKVVKETHVPLDQTPPQVITATIPKS